MQGFSDVGTWPLASIPRTSRALSLAGPATYETSTERIGASRWRIEVWSFEFRMRKGRDGDEPMLELDSDQRFAEGGAFVHSAR